MLATSLLTFSQVWDSQTKRHFPIEGEFVTTEAAITSGNCRGTGKDNPFHRGGNPIFDRRARRTKDEGVAYPGGRGPQARDRNHGRNFGI